MKKTLYKQCTMRKYNSDNVIEVTSFIPAKFAVIGESIRLKNEEKIWEDGWIVEIVGDNTLLESDLPDNHKAIRQHRKYTGDSILK